MSRLGHHIADELMKQSTFQGVPRLIVWPVVEAAIRELSDNIVLGSESETMPDLTDLARCDTCDEWFAEGELAEAGEDGPEMCGPCLQDYRKECAEASR